MRIALPAGTLVCGCVLMPSSGSQQEAPETPEDTAKQKRFITYFSFASDFIRSFSLVVEHRAYEVHDTLEGRQFNPGNEQQQPFCRGTDEVGVPPEMIPFFW